MTRLLFFLWGAALALPAAAESHALIMTISAYQGGVPPLHGVAHDGESARSIARKMGVKDANMRHYKDGELTLAGMQRAFDELQERIADGDQVFIYFSGHGGRQLVRVPGERCAESLITVDGMGFIDVELESRLKRLASKAQKLVVLLDACHSGGATQRSMGKAAGGAAAVSDAIPMIARCRRLQSPPGAPDITGATVEIDRTALRVQTDSTGANIYPVLSLYEDCVMRWGLGPEGKWFSTRL